MCEVVEISDDDEVECLHVQLYAEQRSRDVEENQDANSNLNDEVEDLSPTDRKKVVMVLLLHLYVMKSLG